MCLNAYTIRVVFDDLSARIQLNWLREPKYSTPIWFLLSIAYIALVAFMAQRYWDLYTPQLSYTIGDSYWFSYITLLTVGLGDYYVQPQGLFPCDVVLWAGLLLYGITFLTAFLDRFTSLIASWMPEPEEPLEYHIARTDLFGYGINTPISKSLEALRELVLERKHIRDTGVGCSTIKGQELRHRRSFTGRNDDAITPSGSTINIQRIKILTEKKTLLIQLLMDNQSELEDRMASIALEKPPHSKEIVLVPEEQSRNSDWNTAASNRDTEKDGSLPTAEALEREEDVLNSILLRNEELRNHFGFTAKDEKDGDPVDP